MALLFMDGFDYYEPSTVYGKWTRSGNYSTVSTGGDNNFTTHLLYARPPGGLGMRVQNGGRYLIKGFANTATFISGFNFYKEGLGGAAEILAGYADAGTDQLYLQIDGTNHLQVTRNGTTLATSTNTFSSWTWYHVEIKATINNTTGSYEVRVNGSSTGWIPSATGANTRATSNNFINEVWFGFIAGSYPVRLDDFYIFDSTGSGIDNDFVGPQKIITCYPNAAGNYAQWTGNYAANFSNTNETWADGDATFNQSSTVNQIDTFVVDDVPTGTIAAVQISIQARQDAGAGRSIASMIRNGGTDYEGTTFSTPGSYVYFLDPKSTDPNTGSAWTVAGFNAAEFGYKLKS